MDPRYVMWVAVHFSIAMRSGSKNTVVWEKLTIFRVWGGAQKSNGEHSKMSSKRFCTI